MYIYYCMVYALYIHIIYVHDMLIHVHCQESTSLIIEIIYP